MNDVRSMKQLARRTGLKLDPKPSKSGLVDSWGLRDEDKRLWVSVMFDADGVMVESIADDRPHDVLRREDQVGVVEMRDLERMVKRVRKASRAASDMREARELLKIAREMTAETLGDMMTERQQKGKDKRWWEVLSDIAKATKSRLRISPVPGSLEGSQWLGGQNLQVGFKFPFEWSESRVEAWAVIYEGTGSRGKIAETKTKVEIDQSMSVREAARVLDKQVEKFRKWGQKHVIAPPAIADVIPLIDPKPVKVVVQGNAETYVPKYDRGHWWWRPKSKTHHLMSYYTLDLKDWKTPIEPGNVVEMTLRGGYTGGHHQKTIPVKLRIKKDVVKELEDFLNRKAPKMWTDYIKQNFDKLVEQERETGDALSKYYSKPGYKGD
jgi:hypothetical protein